MSYKIWNFNRKMIKNITEQKKYVDGLPVEMEMFSE